MKTADEKLQAATIASELNKSFYAHGDAVSRTRAKELKLKIAKSDPDLEQLMWQAYVEIEQHMKLREPFDPLRQFLIEPAAAESLRPPAPVVLPPNTPPNMAQQIWNTVAQQAIQGSSEPGVEVECDIINAIMESVHRAAEFRTRLKLSATRHANGEIQLSQTQTEASWRDV